MSSAFFHRYRSAHRDLVWPSQDSYRLPGHVHLCNVWMRKPFAGLSVNGHGHLAYYFYLFAFMVNQPPVNEVPRRWAGVDVGMMRSFRGL